MSGFDPNFTKERYLFRGAFTCPDKNGKSKKRWVIGHLDTPEIITEQDMDDGEFYTYPVDAETVGQCTGLRDKNGKLIFEGDLVRHDSKYGSVISQVIWDGNNVRFVLRGRMITDLFRYQQDSPYEIIGNIHDNPELLQEAAQ